MYRARILGRGGEMLIVALVRCYRVVISPMLAPRCRHFPSCSEYFIEAVQTHGALRGSYYGIKRILRCHPWGTSGLDPVPPAGDAAKSNP